jgi:hypothetical protein
MVVRVRRLATLELGVKRQRDEPRLRRVAERADRGARVAEEKPRTLLVVAEHLGDAVGMACEQLGREPRLECLHRPARLEPSDAVGERHALYRRPGPLVLRFDHADWLNARADPVLGISEVHAPTMPRYSGTGFDQVGSCARSILRLGAWLRQICSCRVRRIGDRSRSRVTR